MEYIRIFNNDSEYQQFKDGDDYITPNICLDREINSIKCKPYTPPPPPVQSSNEIWYTSSDGNIVTPYATSVGIFGANIVSNTYENGQGIIKFDRDVISIGNYAFRGRSSLTSVTIPDSVTKIGGYAFYECSSLTSVTIPNSVTSIGDNAFAYCSRLTSVTIPDSVTSIGVYAFCNCTSLTSITIPNSVTSIGDNAFAYCENLTSVTIPDSVISIGESAFDTCVSLTNITIPDSITSIGSWAFNCCISLTSITIGNSVTSIGDWAFQDCENLTSIYCKPTTPPTGGSAMFNYYTSGRKIYVPTASVNAYKTAEYWSDYTNDIVGYDFEDDGEESGLTFPVTLVEGDNGNIGINLWQYLLSTYQPDIESQPINLPSNNCIIIQGGSLESKLGVNMDSAYYIAYASDDNGYHGEVIKLTYNNSADSYYLFSDGHLGPFDD